jgi:hypothetical protein
MLKAEKEKLNERAPKSVSQLVRIIEFRLDERKREENSSDS